MDRDKILKYASDVLNLEATAITGLISKLDDNFVKAVEAIISLPKTNRIITIGIGKPGLIGRKISATLSSLGCPSFFVHPAEAAHGDLGMITSGDIALVLSNSGETQEVVRILPYLIARGCTIISITSKSTSSLAKFSNICILTGEVKESGEIGIAPTTSTTLLLALGDALALTASYLLKFSASDFASFHPGGTIGKNLTLIDDLIKREEAISVVDEDTLVIEALRNITFSESRPGAALIINKEKQLVGIFTDGNLRRSLLKNTDFLNKEIKYVMTENPKSIKLGCLALEALGIMHRYQIDQLPVVDNENKVIGLLDIQHLAVY